jgi:hypothetical protein
MAFNKDIDMYQIAHKYIDDGQLFEGYALILLQQIRDELRTSNQIKHIKMLSDMMGGKKK